MLEDRMKSLGYGVHLDWRYRQGMKRLAHIESAATAEEFYAGPDSDILLLDQVMIDYFFPFLKLRLCGVKIPGFTDKQNDVMTKVFEAAEEDAIGRFSYSLCLEAGVLCRLPEGRILPYNTDMMPLGQLVYEKLFFDVRSFLDCPEMLSQLLVGDPGRLKRRGSYDILSKIMAFGLGYDEYSRWRGGEESPATEAIQAAMRNMHLYLDGLEILKLERPDDMVHGYGRLLAMLPDIVALASGEYLDIQGYTHGISREEIIALAGLGHQYSWTMRGIMEAFDLLRQFIPAPIENL